MINKKLKINLKKDFEYNIRANMSGYDKINYQVWASHKIAEAFGYDVISIFFKDTEWGTKIGRFIFARDEPDDDGTLTWGIEINFG